MKKFYSILVALLAFVGIAQAQTITFVAGTDATSSDTEKTFTKDGITLEITDGRLNTAEYRIYKNQTLTISSTVGDIQKIVFTCTANGTAKYGPGCFAAQDGYTFEADGKVGTWTGSAASVTFTASTNQVRASQIEVTVQNADPDYVATPKIVPATGTYYDAQEVSIEGAEGTTVYYTIDGTDPTASSTAYTAPFTVESTTTVKAIAVKGDNSSEVATSVITIETLTTKTIAEVLAAGAGAATVSANVVAIATTGLLLQDATGYIFVYTGDAPTVAVGDVVTVAGTTSEYGGRLQFSKPEITKTGTTEITYPTPVVLDGAAFDALVANIEVKYVQVEGTASVSGNYYNLKIEGATNTGSVLASQELLAKIASDATITVKGYFVYVTGSKYGNIIATDIVAPEVVYTEFNSFADAKAATPADEASAINAQLNLTDALVTFVNGNSVYLYDGADGMLCFGSNSSNVKAGDKISGNVKGKLYKRYGNTQLAVTAYEVNVTSSDNEVEPQVVAADVLLAAGADYENELVQIANLAANATAFEDRNITFDAYDESFATVLGTVAVRDNWSVATAMTLNQETPYTVTGLVALYTKDNTTTVQIYPREKADIDNGVEYQFTGDGSLENPYTITDVQNIDSKHAQEGVWVKANIVGYINGSTYTENTAIFSADAPEGEGKTVTVSNILFSNNDVASATVATSIPVALVNKFSARTDLNLKDNPNMLGQQVWLMGNITTYMGTLGLKEVKVYSLDGKEIVVAINAVAADAASASKVIYNVAGQRVQNLNKAGLYIVNGQKVVVK